MPCDSSLGVPAGGAALCSLLMVRRGKSGFRRSVPSDVRRDPSASLARILLRIRLAGSARTRNARRERNGGSPRFGFETPEERSVSTVAGTSAGRPRAPARRDPALAGTPAPLSSAQTPAPTTAYGTRRR